MPAEASAESRGQVMFFESLDTERCYCHSEYLEYRANGDSGDAREKAFCSSLASLMFLGEPEAGGGGCGQQEVVFVSPLFPSLLCNEASLSQ